MKDPPHPLYVFRWTGLFGTISLAEGAGFEPAIELPLYHLSKMAH